MLSRRSASTRPTPRRTIGTTSTTACPSTKCRGRTHGRAIRPGCTGGGSRHEWPGGDNSMTFRPRLLSCRRSRKSRRPLYLERLRKRSDRSLPVAADRQILPSPNWSRSDRPSRLQPFSLNGYLPIGVPMLKRVLALPDKRFAGKGCDHRSIRSRWERRALRDSRGRPLPVWQGCRVVAADEVFLMNWQSADLLDGRYFGVLPTTAIIGERSLSGPAGRIDRVAGSQTFRRFSVRSERATIPPSRPRSRRRRA